MEEQWRLIQWGLPPNYHPKHDSVAPTCGAEEVVGGQCQGCPKPFPSPLSHAPEGSRRDSTHWTLHTVSRMRQLLPPPLGPVPAPPAAPRLPPRAALQGSAPPHAHRTSIALGVDLKRRRQWLTVRGVQDPLQWGQVVVSGWRLGGLTNISAEVVGLMGGWLTAGAWFSGSY